MSQTKWYNINDTTRRLHTHTQTHTHKYSNVQKRKRFLDLDAKNHTGVQIKYFFLQSHLSATLTCYTMSVSFHTDEAKLLAIRADSKY